MPKIIEDLKSTILEAVANDLTILGYKKLNIRGIAKKCNIAVGTIYNYFSSKEILVASLMAKNWLESMHKIDNQISSIKDLYQGFEIIYNGILEFKNNYKNVWSEYTPSMPFYDESKNRHLIFRNQIEERLIKVLEITNNKHYEYFPIITELLITCVMQEDINFDNLKTFIKKLF